MGRRHWRLPAVLLIADRQTDRQRETREQQQQPVAMNVNKALCCIPEPNEIRLGVAALCPAVGQLRVLMYGALRCVALICPYEMPEQQFCVPGLCSTFDRWAFKLLGCLCIKMG